MIQLRVSTIKRLRDRLKETGSRPSIVVSSVSDVLAVHGLLPAEEAAAVQLIEPVLEVMFLMMAADGVIDESERIVIRGAVRELTENYVRSSTLDTLLSTYEKLLAEHGKEARLAAVAERLSDDVPGAEAAFVLAACVAFADGVIDERENDLMNEFAEAVGISEQRANLLLDELENDWKS